MKKGLMLLLIASLGTTALAQGSFNFRVGGDLNGDFGSLGQYSSGDTEDYGYEVGVEYLKPINEKFEFGVGIAYQKHAEISGKEQGYVRKDNNMDTTKYTYESSRGYEDFQGYNSVPVYVTGKYMLNNEWKYKPYLKASLGYSFNFGNDSVHYVDKTEREEIANDDNEITTIHESRTYSTDVENGFYYAAGIGVEYNSFSLEALYQVNTGDLTIGNEKYSADYERISVILNYRF